ncbi:DNA polymerase III subunit alpha [Candidatus Gottesmanbacteria bacterium RIFCSPHIGHO2_02_FULL_40_24]|uniref:DNA polymerase III subunit alpha n=1 Tax=Candidatus Gottesmanbacteria bacterium RIFCSPHIGHO2_01_FULL_40_15 TaxID=1798376 RepID=A0A1F5Z8D1_9BACT|nr:MAG: DNA polymerase III subunit alpha [Candidatus Gottesmanbacteria bacterium RIFCSPHIGHO2_01_FULL_40_15]OGG16800.1 MAG: DNA polymerase III subunit alpha [Candidatus Gottesmanbacteria bacterium RIFCSPHIGHO2_02_FULL_40_24]OGG23121.1 MAG: DNA polymerase III subunit alpha [Candidatus Gottesmanbacteria bacterium RIFCSPHIGHO2_12_FULL_40_13]OGG31823.1 MAG: DNA polymerase III subunit alpha [Candidatus Gottesmanbacteria bacterium RIFCSPLOWO2_02_FULL_40_10]
MSDFVHLHTHSEFSLLDGLSKIPDLVNRAKVLGMDSLGLTDHGSMYGAVKFYLSAREAGIKPIIGVEAYQAGRSRFDKQIGIDNDQYHLVLLAKNNTGYKNMMKLVTHANLEGYYYKPRIDMEVLSEHSEGLICLSGCLNGEVPRHLLNNQEETAEKKARQFLEIFPKDHYYFELQKHSNIPEQDIVNEKLIKLSRKLGVPLVATNDIHYMHADDAYAQEILLCIQTQHTILEAKRPVSMISSPDFYMKSREEMKGLFIQYPEAIENTVKIASMCRTEIELGNWILPNFEVPKGDTADSFFKKLSSQRLAKRYENVTAQLNKRLDYELDIITKKGYSTYFLIVADFVNWAKGKGIAVGPGRGSAAGSLAAYALGITDLDPIKHNIPFERFLNPDRPSPPDIDLDFADDRRDEVIAYVTEKYGNDRVAQIITFGTMEARAAVRDVGRALGMPYAQPDRIAKLIPPGAQGFPMTIDKAIQTSQELANAYQSESETKTLLDLARKLEGVARHASVHAAGVVISDKPLTNYTPLQRETKGQRIITQYDMYCLDLNAADGKAVGLLKMDLLGLRNLTILENAIRFVRQSKGEVIDLRKISLENPDVYKLISSGETTGIFQLESAGMRRLARELKPTKFSDIAAMVALFRPGPMEWIPTFIESKENPKKIKYLHPDLKSILSETYGIAVYQEQCMQIANKMAGYSMVEADKLRMAIGKKKREVMKKEKEKFIKGCQSRGLSNSMAEKIFSLIEKFVGYGFNKAHSASYGMIAYQTAYMKVKYPVEFMTAVLAAESRGASGPVRDEKIARAILECRRMDIELLSPDINKSEVEFIIEEQSSGKGRIRFGLSAIKNVGTAAIDSILTARDKGGNFKSMTDFAKKVDLSKVNRKTVESLIKAGAFDQFGNRASLLAAFSDIIEKIHKQKSKKDDGQVSLFMMDDDDNIEDALPEIEELSREELLMFEKQYLGFYITEHPLSSQIEDLEKRVTHRINALTQTKSTVIIGGIITQIKKITTRNGGNEMAFVKIDDFTGSCELVVFPAIFERTKLTWSTDRVVLVKGKISERDDRISVLVDDVKLLTS